MLWQRGKAYSQDLRERVFAAADDGQLVGQIARQLHVSVSYVSKVLTRRRRTGQTEALALRSHVPPKLASLHGAIREQVTACPDATIAEVRAWLSKTHQVSASNGLMWKTLAEKSRSTRLNRPARMSLPAAPSGVRNSQG